MAKTQKRPPTKGYMCATDWHIEAPWKQETGFPEIYRTIKALKADRNCWRFCGIVEVKLKLKRYVLKPKKDRK